MSDKEPVTLKKKFIDFMGLVGSGVVIFIAWLIFNDNLPDNIQSYYSYFYILALLGIIGLAGEKGTITILSFILPVLLGASTLVLKFNPEQYPVSQWWDLYSILVLICVGFLAFLFYRFEQIRKNAGMLDLDLKGRANPMQALKYKKSQESKQKAADEQLETGLKKDKDQGDKNKKPDNVKNAPDTDLKEESASLETPEERMEREMREIRDDFSRRSMKLTTTLIRIKNLSKSLDRDEIFSNILEIIEKGMDASRVQLLLNDEQDKRLVVAKAVGMKPREYSEIEISYDEDSMITYLLRQPVNVATGGARALGVKECKMDPKARGLINQGTIKSIIVVPIYVESKVFAMVNVEKMKDPDYTKDDTNLIATCADVAGLVMKNARLYSATMPDLVSAKQLSEEQLKRNEELKGSLTRIVSPEVAEMIMHNPSELKLGGSKSEVTVFFSDIRGFTKMSENMDPTDVVDQLNVYFTRMTDILMTFQGTLDKYVGDELMALFGAPVSREDDPIRAVLCAVLMLEALEELHEKWKQENRPLMKIGIGINTGVVTAGYMGSEKQLSYTVIGDEVNLASRVMSVAQGMEILITRSTYERVKDYFIAKQLDSVMVKGKSKPIEVFQVLSLKEGIDTSEFVKSGSGTLISSEQPTTKVGSINKVEEVEQVSDKGSEQLNIKIDKEEKLIECQQCGTENDMQQKFCAKCGMPIF